MKEEPYKIRAHHVLCLNFFQGKGYSGEFVDNMNQVKSKLEKNPLVCITSQADIICRVCPNNDAGICKDKEKVAEYDRQVFARCHISEGEIMPFLNFKNLVRDNILLLGKRKEICGNCQWDSLCVIQKTLEGDKP